MLLFGALCHVCGPEGEQGNICCCLKKKKAEKGPEENFETERQAAVKEVN